MKTPKTVLGAGLFALLLAASPGRTASLRPAAGDDGRADRLFTRRLALLVGANNGGATRPALRYAAGDARAVGRVLEDMGGVLPGDGRYLMDPDRAGLLEAIRSLAAEADLARQASRRVEVLFYFSGHSDEEALFLGEERVLYTELRDLVTALNADVRIAILDSCASGALTLPKGVIKRAPFLLDTAYDMKGTAFMASSSAGEAAQESGRLGRSFFTHNLVSGMRGAADMNLDGRVTLNEAYQFAFDGTLTQTERTMAGAQHPTRHIQMSGTGDVVITELRKSAAVLVLEAGFAGQVFIHDAAGALLVELNKADGREVAIGLDVGGYRVFAVGGSGALETEFSLGEGQSLVVGRSDFAKAARIPATVRGPAKSGPAGKSRSSGGFGWRVELLGGLGAIDPDDLNMRGEYDRMSSEYYGSDCLAYRVAQGEIRAFEKTSEGNGFRRLRRSLPFGIRIRKRVWSWLDISMGLTHFADSRSASFADFYRVTELDGGTSTYTERFDDYTLAVKGYLPAVGLHIGGKITPSLRLEAVAAAGPLFAECRYAFRYESTLTSPSGDSETPDAGILDEKGRGVGPAFLLGARLDYSLARRHGVFLEGGYAFQTVRDLSGPGVRSGQSHRDAWEGEWAMKQMVQIEPWGTGRFLWPSNGWELFGGAWWRARDFTLDLSGFQLKAGLFFRF